MPSNEFRGIPIAALDFYEDLEDDNSKAFWTAHKQVYDESVRAPMEALCQALAPEFGPSKLFRPYRDVRFARDKTPYKTHQGAWFTEASLYLELSAPGLMVAGGYWYCASDQIGRLRRAIDDDVAGAALERVLARAEKAKYTIGGDTLTRVPAGFAKEHPRVELLKRKALTGRRVLGAPNWLSTSKATSEVAKAWRPLLPLRDWLDTHVGPANDPSTRR